jgi:paraquat-inducible protein B
VSVAKPVVNDKSGLGFLTSIWIVPIIAVIISLSLAYNHFSQLGPEIKIYFNSSAGLKVGQSKVKYRNVDVGVITKILLNDDNGVIVLVRMDNGTKKYLNNETKFWIVKPEVDSSGVSGLETILTGTYINLYTQKDESYKKVFIGLEKPFEVHDRGHRFTLTTNKATNVKIGSPIYYRNIQIGKVEKIELDEDLSLNIGIVIKDEYRKFINRSTKFWVQSVMDFNFENSNFNLNLAPLSHMLKGGVSIFTNPNIKDTAISEKFKFTLYPNKVSSLNKKIGLGGEYIKKFSIELDDRISKLEMYASVKFNGFIVGEVTNISYNYDTQVGKIRSTVDVNVDTSAFIDAKLPKVSGFDNLKRAVKKGLRARVDAENPLTGTLFVDLDFIKEYNTTHQITYLQDKRYLLPSYRMKESKIMENVNEIMQKIKDLPLEELLTSTNALIKNSNQPLTNLLEELQTSLKLMNKMLATNDTQNLPKELNRSMHRLNALLLSTKRLVEGDKQKSLLASQLSTMLKELTNASMSINTLIKKLDKKPNALIFGD